MFSKEAFIAIANGKPPSSFLAAKVLHGSSAALFPAAALECLINEMEVEDVNGSNHGSNSSNGSNAGDYHGLGKPPSPKRVC